MSGPRLKVLVLGGTAWLGGQLAREALDRGHAVWCLARGESGRAPDGATLVGADRRSEDAYDEVRTRDWDVVIDVCWQPGLVRSALAALRERADRWIYVSSCSVYASHADRGADETAELLAATDLVDEAGIDLYGQAKVACELACRAAENGTAGTYDAVGRTIALAEFIDLSRTIGGHTGPVLAAADEWLLAEGVEEFMGPGSLPLWLADPGWQGLCARSGQAAATAGLIPRPISQTLKDTLAWERQQGLDRIRKAGLSIEREAELLSRLAHA